MFFYELSSRIDFQEKMKSLIDVRKKRRIKTSVIKLRRFSRAEFSLKDVFVESTSPKSEGRPRTRKAYQPNSSPLNLSY